MIQWYCTRSLQQLTLVFCWKTACHVFFSQLNQNRFALKSAFRVLWTFELSRIYPNETQLRQSSWKLVTLCNSTPGIQAHAMKTSQMYECITLSLCCCGCIHIGRCRQLMLCLQWPKGRCDVSIQLPLLGVMTEIRDGRTIQTPSHFGGTCSIAIAKKTLGLHSWLHGWHTRMYSNSTPVLMCAL